MQSDSTLVKIKHLDYDDVCSAGSEYRDAAIIARTARIKVINYSYKLMRQIVTNNSC